MQNPRRGGKAEKSILLVLSALFTAFLVLSVSFFLVLFDHGFYDHAYSKYGTYDTLGVEGVRDLTDNLINYLISENTEINEVAALRIFPADEKSHLTDVRNMIRTGRNIALACLLGLILVIFRLRARGWLEQEWRRMLKYSAYVIGGALVFTFIISFFWFDQAFAVFHHVFFPQGNYTFAADTLTKTLFPDPFFRDYALKMLFHILIMGLMIYYVGASFGVKKAEKQVKEKKK